MKRLYSIILLMLFTAIIFPAEIWHDCSHSGESTEIETETAVSEPVCEICSFHFSSFQPELSFTPDLLRHSESFTLVRIASAYVFSGSSLSPGRAPPVSL